MNVQEIITLKRKMISTENKHKNVHKSNNSGFNNLHSKRCVIQYSVLYAEYRIRIV
jgi:hypothetical protein